MSSPLPLDLRIAPPISRDEEYVAGDLFDQGPARALALGGTRRSSSGANDVLQEIVERFPERRISLHARVALGNPHTIDYKSVLPTDDLDVAVASRRPIPDEATVSSSPCSSTRPNGARVSRAHSLPRPSPSGRRSGWSCGADAAAAKTIDAAIDALAARKVHGKPIKPEVIEDLKETRKELAPKPKAKPRAKAKA